MKSQAPSPSLREVGGWITVVRGCSWFELVHAGLSATNSFPVLSSAKRDWQWTEGAVVSLSLSASHRRFGALN